MRVTVCHLPHEHIELARAWAALCDHTIAKMSQLVLLPEFALLEAVWEIEQFDEARWTAVRLQSDVELRRIPQLRAEYVVGTRPVEEHGRRLNQAYLWSASAGIQPLRAKYFLPEEAGSWERTWFDQGDPEFKLFQAGLASFGVNICTELWHTETFPSYSMLGAQMVLSPRATEFSTSAKWHAAGVVAAVRSGAFSLSSNRVNASSSGAATGWIIDPEGESLAVTTTNEPFATRDINLEHAVRAKQTYPRYVFARSAREADTQT